MGVHVCVCACERLGVGEGTLCNLGLIYRDRRDTASYRAIAVGEPVFRLYASILNQRLLDYTEEHGLRAPTQAGFRPGLSVVHQLFSLQHLTERQRQRRQRLYVCFLDLQGAFDRVPRQVLWQALQRLGLHGAMLAGISSPLQYSCHCHQDSRPQGACPAS